MMSEIILLCVTPLATVAFFIFLFLLMADKSYPRYKYRDLQPGGGPTRSHMAEIVFNNYPNPKIKVVLDIVKGPRAWGWLLSKWRWLGQRRDWPTKEVEVEPGIRYVDRCEDHVKYILETIPVNYYGSTLGLRVSFRNLCRFEKQWTPIRFQPGDKLKPEYSVNT